MCGCIRVCLRVYLCVCVCVYVLFLYIFMWLDVDLCLIVEISGFNKIWSIPLI